MKVDGRIHLGDLREIARRRVKVVGATTLGAILASYWLAMALPNKYESFATVLVTPQSVAPELVAAGVPESDLNNRLYLMSAQILSRGRLSRIIDELGLYPNESQYLVREEVIDLMRENVGVAPVLPELDRGVGLRSRDEEINQFRIAFTDRSAATAMRVAQHLSNDFIEQHIESRISLSQKSLEFIEDELGRLAERIREVEAKVAAIKAENPGRLPEDMVATQRRLERLMTDMAYAQRARGEATSDEAFFRSQVNNAPASAGEVTPESRLKMLDLTIAEFKAKGFTDKHPDVVKVTLEKVELRNAIARKKTLSDTQKDQFLTFSQQSAEAERRRATLRRSASEAEIERLEKAIDELQSMLAGTPAVAEVLDGLEREYRHLFDSYQDFSTRHLEATVQAQLERRQLGEQFRVLESAFIAPKPTSPNRALILILGVFFAIAIGVAVGVLIESTDASIHSARQLQVATGIPVLAAVPTILLEADLAALRRSRIRAACGTVAVVCLALAGGAANYVWVNGVPGFLTGEAGFEQSRSAGSRPVQSGAGR
jgi:polysaccharide chain length determinant protein (PEP-CTERM system associated)